MIIWPTLFLDLLIAVIVVLWAYLAWRGFSKNEFWRLGGGGWRLSERFTFDWWFCTAFNLLYLGCLIYACAIKFGPSAMVFWK
jgi:hypothetical protein